MKIAIIDYGTGNLFSVQRALDQLSIVADLKKDGGNLNAYDGVILPGVGAFGAAMDALRRQDLVGPIKDYAFSDKPLLGICLGMQLLATNSHEHGHHEGLDIIPGQVVHLSNLPGKGDTVPTIFPHIGWNSYECNVPGDESILAFSGAQPFVYFVHSFAFQPENKRHCLALTCYGGITFCSAVQREKVLGVQFHPERSGEVGLRVLSGFVSICRGESSSNSLGC